MTLEELFDIARREAWYVQVYGEGSCEIERRNDEGWYEQWLAARTVRDALQAAVDETQRQARTQADGQQPERLLFT